MPLFKRKKKEPEPPKERHLVKKVFFVSGTGYYQDNMMKLATPNEKYDTAQPAEDDYVKVFRYNFRNKPLSIEDDPDYPGQIRILVDGLKIGVLDNDDSNEMREILRHEVKYITVHMNDGPYKLISPSGAVEEMDSRIHAKLSVGYVEEI